MSELVIQASELKKIVTNILRSSQLTEEHAQIITDVYVTADLRGIHSHGVSRICSLLLPLIENKIMDIKATHNIENISATQKKYAGNKAPGPVTSYFAMNDCIQMALKNGTGIVSVVDSTHFGLASYYSLMASRDGLIGIAITNGNPAVVPPGANKPILGTNAISISFPNESDPIVLDIALSSTSLGKLYLEAEKDRTVPTEWCSDYVLDSLNIKESNKIDPAVIYKNRSISPLGSGEGQYKGFNLGLIVDLMLSLLFGGNLSIQLNYGEASHVFIAVKPSSFNSSTSYRNTIQTLLDSIDSLKYTKGFERYRIPGVRANRTFVKYSNEGIPLCSKTYNELLEKMNSINYIGG